MDFSFLEISATIFSRSSFDVTSHGPTLPYFSQRVNAVDLNAVVIRTV